MKKRRRLFDYLNANRFDKPDAKDEDTAPTLKRYFKLLWRKFWKLVSVSLLALLQTIPLLIIVYLYINTSKTPTANDVAFSTLYGLHQADPEASTGILLHFFGAQMNVPVYSVGFYIGIGLCILFLLVTFGWQNAGMTYILRSIVRGEPVFILSDYFYAVKRNLKPGLILGIIDMAVLTLLGLDVLFFYSRTGFFNDVGFFFTCALAILWLLIRMYLYLILVTFDMKTFKILKNALIFSVLGIKRNFMAVLGFIILTAIVILGFPLFSLTPLSIAPAIILPLLYYPGVLYFTCAYASYPIIDRYMIAPYRKEEATEDGDLVENDEKNQE